MVGQFETSAATATATAENGGDVKSFSSIAMVDKEPTIHEVSTEEVTEEEGEETVEVIRSPLPDTTLPGPVVPAATGTPHSSSWMFTQCRSIWTPKNWVYVAVGCLVCALWAVDVHVVYSVLLVGAGLECCWRCEDLALFADNADIRADRECSLTGMVRWVFIGLTVVCYLVLYILHFVIMGTLVK